MVHIVDQVTEVVVLAHSFQTDPSDVVHPDLLHSPEDVLHSHSDLAHLFVEDWIGFAQWFVAMVRSRVIPEVIVLVTAPALLRCSLIIPFPGNHLVFRNNLCKALLVSCDCIGVLSSESRE